MFLNNVRFQRYPQIGIWAIFPWDMAQNVVMHIEILVHGKFWPSGASTTAPMGMRPKVDAVLTLWGQDQLVKKK